MWIKCTGCTSSDLEQSAKAVGYLRRPFFSLHCIFSMLSDRCVWYRSRFVILHCILAAVKNQVPKNFFIKLKNFCFRYVLILDFSHQHNKLRISKPQANDIRSNPYRSRKEMKGRSIENNYIRSARFTNSTKANFKGFGNSKYFCLNKRR